MPLDQRIIILRTDTDQVQLELRTVLSASWELWATVEDRPSHEETPPDTTRQFIAERIFTIRWNEEIAPGGSLPGGDTYAVDRACWRAAVADNPNVEPSVLIVQNRASPIWRLTAAKINDRRGRRRFLTLEGELKL